ncbi:glycyl-tRNA synthetease [Methanoculleus taiwanensis]|uniref:glycine--tRNA ligase n=1 Tax=Methanoculleus taiwanensis TaxID=1550565 RepID=A0A498GXV5_9EURY|nr:glycine--tRNA ligase [Methanoculleus taiwanensis]RXE55579.1 glycyl-tRNA synthetease [Methanoculleus taiwanensis]
MNDIYEKVMEVAKRRGFVWPSSEIYGSVAGFIDYGPLGAMTKRNVENVWRSFYIIQEGYYEIECPTVGTEDIYVASGHVKEFADKMCQCPHCREYLRADHIVEEHGVEGAGALSAEVLKAKIYELPCPSCGEVMGETDVFNFNLMFETTIGPGSQRTGYLRPETAQGIFTDFARLLRFYRDKLPFGAVQIGKSYRNEISPRQGMIRLREFSQAEAEIFVHPDEKQHPSFHRYAEYEVPLLTYGLQETGQPPVRKTMRNAVDEGVVANEYVAYYIALTHELLVTIGVDPEKLRFRQHMPDERAHYAMDCWDAEVFSGRFGWVEIVGIADRTDYDLRAHSTTSGSSFTVFVPFEEARRALVKRIVPDMGVLGPKYRGKAKAIADAMAEATPGPEGVTVTVEGEEIFVPADLYQIREEETEVRGEEIMPHVIEPSYGIDRMMYVVLEHAYAEEEVEDELRRVLRLPPAVAPVKVAVFPLMNRDGLDVIARKITDTLGQRGIVAQYDDSGAIGRRYRRQDEIGTPFAITVDYDTREDDTVTIRDRDSMDQVRIPLGQVPEVVCSLVAGTMTFRDLSA